MDPVGLSWDVWTPHTRALSPGPHIGQAKPKTRKLGLRQGGVEATPENVCKVSQRRWGAVIAHKATWAGRQQGRRLRPLPTRQEAREGRRGLSKGKELLESEAIGDEESPILF